MLCPVCETHEMRSTDPDIVCCIDCARTGRDMEFFLSSPVRDEMIKKIRAMPHVLSANLWPTLPGAFQLAVILYDGRLVLTAAVIPAGENIWAVAPAIPPLNGLWIAGVQTPNDDVPNEWDGDMGELLTSAEPGKGVTDLEVVDLIAELDDGVHGPPPPPPEPAREINPMVPLQFDPDWVLHPGATLDDWIEAARQDGDLPWMQLKDAGLEPVVVYRLLIGEQEVTPELAATIHQATGISESFWLSAERKFREGLAAGKRWVP